MKKIDLQKYIYAFDVDASNAKDCWSDLLYNPNKDIQNLLNHIIQELGYDSDYVPSYILLKDIYVHLNFINLYSDDEWEKFIRGGLPSLNDCITSALEVRCVAPVENIFKWTAEPISNDFVATGQNYNVGDNLQDEILVGYVVWNHVISQAIYGFFLSQMYGNAEGGREEYGGKCGFVVSKKESKALEDDEIGELIILTSDRPITIAPCPKPDLNISNLVNDQVDAKLKGFVERLEELEKKVKDLQNKQKEYGHKWKPCYR